MKDKYIRPLTDYQIAESFPDCRDIAQRNIAILSVGVQHYKALIKQDAINVHVMAADPAVKQINRLKRYLKLTEPMRDILDIPKARAVPIQSLYEFERCHESSKQIKCSCCFHKDTRPSAVIYLKSNTYHCFSCGAHFDSIGFQMKMKNINFIDAVKQLSN